ncbi:methyltransferase domain-containing protein [Parasedimentitalea maritima]|uniref:Methyltransferase domain-containing protein n=1 Tax=Parasedimentitalea maritima TaxID=2578117 RepID=A0ABY2URP4_9RHOB|nr:methyltransferase domain-containing protein [Zongyanglinia marina]TLP58396.1 methyltransferase domain-containing protein [Zongyanglinia marina]
MSELDWKPDLYGQFAGLRLRPALDLLMRIGSLPDGGICDLGCGAGTVGPILATRFRGRQLVGVDSSPAMLAKAAALDIYDDLVEADVAHWESETSPALIFCNAVLHWLPDHDALLPRLVAMLPAGGILAVQLPNQNQAPSHQLWHDLVDRHYPGRFDSQSGPGILKATEYHALLSQFGSVDVWETDYLQHLPPADEGHPVRRFTESTFARPVLATLQQAEQKHLIELYDAEIETVYPRKADGSVLFSFRRLFFKLDIPT